MDIDILITEIEERPCLWDISHRDYKNRNKKNEEWLNVANAVTDDFELRTETEQKVIVQEVIGKWRTVRDNFVRSQKKQNETKNSGFTTKNVTRYVYEDQLSFLKKCPKSRNTAGSRPIHLGADDTAKFEPQHDIKDETVTSDNNNQNANHFRCRPQKKKKVNSEDKLGTFVDSRQTSHNDDDEDMSFYKSTLPIVKTFNMDEKMQFRIELMQLIQNIKRSKPSITTGIAGPSSSVVPTRAPISRQAGARMLTMETPFSDRCEVAGLLNLHGQL